MNTDQLPLTPEIFKIVCDFYWKDQDPIEITDESIADLVEEALIDLELQKSTEENFFPLDPFQPFDLFMHEVFKKLKELKESSQISLIANLMEEFKKGILIRPNLAAAQKERELEKRSILIKLPPLISEEEISEEEWVFEIYESNLKNLVCVFKSNSKRTEGYFRVQLLFILLDDDNKENDDNQVESEGFQILFTSDELSFNVCSKEIHNLGKKLEEKGLSLENDRVKILSTISFFDENGHVTILTDQEEEQAILDVKDDR